MTYSEKLRDPRWQKMRLRIMERDQFTCQKCGDNEVTLNVHHIAYRKGCAPWEYDPSHLVTLCEICHKEVSSDECSLLFGKLMVKNSDNDVTSVLEFLNLDNPCESLAMLICSIGPAKAEKIISRLAGHAANNHVECQDLSPASIMANSALDAMWHEGYRQCYSQHVGKSDGVEQ